MTRKEQILQAVSNYKNHFPDGFINEHTYVDGAEWADENPDEKMIAKYLYEKKGYPIDLNGNLPSFDETMKDAEKYLKYKQDKFIDKAAVWLNTCFISHDEYGIISNQFDTEEEMIDDFKQFMKGE